MKESLARVMQWAKSHKLLAGIIAALVIFLAYITIKRGGGSGGSSGDQVSDPTSDQTSAPLGSADLSNLGGPSGDNASPVPVAQNGGGISSPGSSSRIDTGSNYGMDQVPDYGAFDTSSYALSQGAPISSTSLDTLHYDGVIPPSPIAEAVAKNPGLASAKRVTPSPIAAALQAHPTLKSASKAPPKNTGVVKPSPIAQAVTLHPTLKNASRVTPPVVLKTPAELAGLPRLYTGTYNGVIYLMGYITGYTSRGSTGGSSKVR